MRRPVLAVFGIAVALLALIAVALAIALWTVDVNRFVPVIAEHVAEATGRELRVEGGATLRRSRHPRLELRDVTLSNSSWASTPFLVRAKRLDVQVALLPLLQRRIEVEEIALIEPAIALERDAAGHGNWELARAGARAGGAPASSAAAAVAVGELRIEQGTFSYRGAPGAVPTTVRVDRLVVHGANPEAPLTAELAASVAGIGLAGTLRTGPIATLRSPGTAFPLAFDGEVAGRKAKLDTRIVLDAGATRLDPLALAFGDTSVTGSVAIQGEGDKRTIVVHASAPRLQVADLSLLAPTNAVAAGPARSVAAPSRFVIPETPLPLGLGRDARVQGDLDIGDLAFTPERHAQSVRLAFALDPSHLEVSHLEAGVWGGRIEGRAVVDRGGATPRVEAHLTGRDLDLGTLLAVLGAPREVRGGKTALRLDVTGHGDSAHALASTATGNLELVVGTATLVDSKADAAAMLTQLSAAMNPLHATERATELKCAVVRTPLANGIARFDRTVALETQTLGAAATGTVDLRDETLDLAVHPTIREGIPIDIGQVVDLVRVRGTWRAPHVTVDAMSSATAVARLGAVVATGGLPALGGLFVLGSATQDGPCAVALGAANARKPSPRPSPADAATKPAEDLLKGLGKLFQR